jgi:hypothetical protein
MSIGEGAISFWDASVPQQFHEMDRATVPQAVLAAYRRQGGPADVKWGVTLPATMTRELNEFLGSSSGGQLIIAASGEIELRH